MPIVCSFCNNFVIKIIHVQKEERLRSAHVQLAASRPSAVSARLASSAGQLADEWDTRVAISADDRLPRIALQRRQQHVIYYVDSTPATRLPLLSYVQFTLPPPAAMQLSSVVASSGGN